MKKNNYLKGFIIGALFGLTYVILGLGFLYLYGSYFSSRPPGLQLDKLILIIPAVILFFTMYPVLTLGGLLVHLGLNDYYATFISGAIVVLIFGLAGSFISFMMSPKKSE